MKIHTRPLHMIALAALFTTTTLSGALANMSEMASERLKAIVEKQGAVIEWERLDIDGDDSVLVNVEVGSTEGRLPIGDITLTGISQAAQGIRIEEMTFDDMEFGDDTGAISVGASELTGVLLPDDANLDNYGGTLFYESAHVSNISVSVENDEIVSMSDFNTTLSAPVDGNPMTYTGTADEFYLDLSIVEDPNQRAVLEALDYLELTGSFAFEGYWQPEGGRFALSQYDITVDDAGTLGITADIDGYTPAFIASLRELQLQMAANPDADSSAQGLAILGLMQQLTFHSAEISFSDDSLTNKVLEFVAASQGMRPADIANQAKAVLPFALGQLGNPELTMQATQAVSAYLDNPQSIRLRAAPASPVPFALIMAAAMSAPAELTKTLGVTVVSND